MPRVNAPGPVRTSCRPWRSVAHRHTGDAQLLCGLKEVPMNKTYQALMGITALAFGVQAAAQVTLHENEGFQGRAFSSQQRSPNLQRSGFNDRASSAIVVGQRW